MKNAITNLMTHIRTPETLYHAALKDKTLNPDPVQEKAVEALQNLFQEVENAHHAPKKSWLERVTGLGKAEEPIKGLYMYGGVGRGKSMLMDLFYDCLADDIKKRRVHFHAFMIEVHDYIHSRREGTEIIGGVDSALPSLAQRIAENAQILCFDEFHVVDVADAMILGRLFTALFDHGVIIVATSNWEPDRLYEGGLQRERFLPFIALLKERMRVFHLDSETDYRTIKLQETGTYFTPLGEGAAKKADDIFARLTNREVPGEEEIEVKGRIIPVYAAANGVARFSFSQLCEKPHGAEDYLAIAKTYRAIILEGIPKMGYDRRNEAKRLMILIDALYENKVKLVITAEAAPEKLYYGGDHAFEFHRTVSRLNEMCFGKAV